MTRHSWLAPWAASGTLRASSNSRPLCTRRVASPPSSRIMLGPIQSAPAASASALQSKICEVHHQYSSRVSPFQAKTGTPAGASTVPVGPTATAAAASSWVEKMLQLAQRTCAPRATRVSMSTAVWTVMWRLPAMRAPASGRAGPNSSRSAMRPGISCSARRNWWRPAAARLRSATLKGRAVSAVIPPFSPTRHRVARPWRERKRRRSARFAPSEVRSGRSGPHLLRFRSDTRGQAAGRRGAGARGRSVGADEGEHVVADALHDGDGACLHVESQQGLRVGGPHVEPPEDAVGGSAHGEPVELVELL